MLRLVNVFKYYKDKKNSITALNDLCIDFPSFGLVMITGPSGCGKSTLLSVLALNNPIDKGEYFFFGKSSKDLSSKRKAKIKAQAIGMVFQNNFLISALSAKDNIALAAGIAGNNIKKSFRLSMSILEKMNLSYIADQKAISLSGGETQRVALGRAIVNKPLILLADEPTGALDELNKILIMEILKEYSKTSLVIMVTHDLELGNAYADRVISLNNGTITSDKETTTFLKNNGKLKFSRHKQIWWFNKFFKRKTTTKPMNFPTMMSISFGLVCSLLVFGFQQNVLSMTASAASLMLDSHTFRVSKKYSQEIPGSPLTLVRYQQPESFEIQSLISLGVEAIQEPSFSTLFPELIPIKLNKVILENVPFTPVWSFNNSQLSNLFLQGSNPIDSIFNVAINKKMAVLIKERFAINPIGLVLEMDYEYIDEIQNGTNGNIPIRDTFIFKENLIITCVVEEIDFFSVPRIYYSIMGAKNYLQSKVMENLSLSTGNEVNWYQRLSNARPDETITNYERWVYPLNSKSFEKIVNISNKTAGDKIDLYFHGNFLNRLSLMSQVGQAGVSVALIFVFLLLSGSTLIQGIMVYHWMVENRVDHAVLINLGASPILLSGFFLFSFIKTSLICSFGSSIFAALLIKILNNFISIQWKLNSFIISPLDTIKNIPSFGLFMCFVLGLVTIFSASIGPLLKLQAVSVTKELNEE